MTTRSDGEKGERMYDILLSIGSFVLHPDSLEWYDSTYSRIDSRAQGCKLQVARINN